MIIDTHAHIYPDKIAEKASASISDFYDVAMTSNGTIASLLELEKRAGVSKCLVHSVATTPGQVQKINDFIIESQNQYPDQLIGFATMHPDFPNIEREVERVIKAGLRGIKLHPDFQKFMIDEDRACKIYEAAEGRLVMLFHIGDSRYEYSRPERLARILDWFPKLDVIGAHFAGYSVWDDAIKALAGKRLWVDTSSSMFKLSSDQVRHLIDIYGADKVLFASDYPMWDPKEELERLNQIPLTDEEKEMILHTNAEKLLQLS